jgi:CheY-like chemotaxis protein
MISTQINILLADDDADDCLLFEEALKELPLLTSLSIVKNGEELMERLNQKEIKFPDVLFLDLNMPRKNGFAALGEIKRDSNLSIIPVIIFSTSNEEDCITQVFKDAAHYYIHKPADFSDFKKTIFKVLNLIVQKSLPLPTKEKFVIKLD